MYTVMSIFVCSLFELDEQEETFEMDRGDLNVLLSRFPEEEDLATPLPKTPSSDEEITLVKHQSTPTPTKLYV